MREDEDTRTAATVAVLMEFPEMAAALRPLLDDSTVVHLADYPAACLIGSMPSAVPDRPHIVVGLTRTDWTTTGGVEVSHLMRSFPDVQILIACGLASGVQSPESHVRLGDVVVAVDGIIHYEHARQAAGRVIDMTRGLPDVSPVLRRADRALEVRELSGADSLPRLIEGYELAWPTFRRPEPRQPRIHRGTIGTGDRLLRDVRERDALAARYGMIAFEMEDAGFAAGADSAPQGGLAVRGISDYGGLEKDDSWHQAAALAAVAYTRILLGECHPFSPNLPRGEPPGTSSTRTRRLVDLLMALPLALDDVELRAVTASLPVSIRMRVAYSSSRRVQIISLVDACLQTPEGMTVLLDVLGQVAAPDSLTMRELAAAVAAYGEPSA